MGKNRKRKEKKLKERQEKKKDQYYEMAHAPISKIIPKLAVPTIISMLVTSIYNMADTFFIGQTQDPLQVAAVSLATPVFMIFMALGNLFGIGGSSAISRALGEKHKERAWHISSFCCYGALGLGVIVAIFSVLGMEVILRLIGASENTIGFARKYLLIISIGAPTILFSTAFANILRGEGAARESMVGNLLGTIVNIVLDPVMILMLGWGVTGAALATIIGNIAAVVIGFIMEFFLFSVDYSRTERLQFEDDEYYYYVKAIPKISVTAPEKTVKHINERKETGGIAGTEPERRQRSKSGQTKKTAVRKTKTASKVKRPKSPAVQRPTRVGGNTDEILLAQSLKEELDIQSIVENELNSDNK